MLQYMYRHVHGLNCIECTYLLNAADKPGVYKAGANADHVEPKTTDAW